jgi:hypothetical protein
MSFNDAAQRTGNTRSGGPNGTTLSSSSKSQHNGSVNNNNNAGGEGNFPDQLQMFQRRTIQTKDKLAEMKRRKVSVAEKSELDKELKEMRESESRLKNQLDYQLKQLEVAQRSNETAQRRVALDKLSKDFQKIRGIAQSVYNDAGFISVDNGGRNGMTYNPVEDAGSGSQPLSAGVGKNQPQMQMQEAQIQMLGESVDEAIALEREREIRQMNQDIVLVNEMMRYFVFELL